MRVGIPREIKADEYRVALMPVGAELLVRSGHAVLVETQAGMGSGFSDEDYAKVGATIVPTHEQVIADAELIVKVKEPQPAEIAAFKPGQMVFGYFHFAADQDLTQGCLESGVTAIAYETIADRAGRLPLLTPMSEIAGKMSIQEGAKFLEKPMMGRGILLGGVPGVAPARVVVLGGGIVGTNAAKVAAGLGANVAIMDVNLERLRYLSDVMPANVQTIYSDAHTVRDYIAAADLVIGAVLIPGKKAPRLVMRDDLKRMLNGAVVVDVAIDQGGCFETSRPTSHQHPTYVVEGVVHYCVTNMPGAVGRTSTIALCNATLPYVLRLANQGYEKAAAADAGFAEGINMIAGRLTNAAVAESLHLEHQPLPSKGAAQKEAAMSSNRIEQLQKMLQKEPDDPFLLYGLAMEHKKTSAWESALAAFDRVLAIDPAYCYAYYQKGAVLEEIDDLERARSVYKEGIAAAQRKGDAHARSELEAALAIIE